MSTYSCVLIFFTYFVLVFGLHIPVFQHAYRRNNVNRAVVDDFATDFNVDYASIRVDAKSLYIRHFISIFVLHICLLQKNFRDDMLYC